MHLMIVSAEFQIAKTALLNNVIITLIVAVLAQMHIVSTT